jgi:hypothetical protein
MLDVSPGVCLGAEEEYFLASFTRRLIKIAAIAGAHGGTSAVDVLKTMLLPAIALDRRGFVADVTAAADALFDDNIKIKDKRLFVRDLEARAFLDAALDELTSPVKSLVADSPIIVERLDKSLVILRIWPLEGVAHSPEQELQSSRYAEFVGPPRAFRLRHDPGRLTS